MNILISDTNILIDIIELEMFNTFLQLPFNIKTTDFVVNIELGDEIQLKVFEAALENKIEILSASYHQLKEIQQLYVNSKGLSLTDCEIYFFTKETIGSILLSGDGRLRKYARSNGLAVRGILWIFDLFEEYEFYTKKFLAKKMRELVF